MDAEKIVENMKAVLKRAKRKKIPNKSKPEKNKIETSNCEEDKEISELMTKNWQMKTPPVNKSENSRDKERDMDNAARKVNAFEKMMSRKSNLVESPSQAQESDEKLTRTDSSKKRTRVKDDCLENSSKKRKVKDSLQKIQLDSNENSIDQTDVRQAERPKRSCSNKIDYSLFVNSPEKKSPVKTSTRGTVEKKSIVKTPSTSEKSKENLKLAPLFTRKNKKCLMKESIESENFDDTQKEAATRENEKQEKIESERPRRSCVIKTDYSIFDTSLENNSPEKRPLRSRSETDNISKQCDVKEVLQITPTKNVIVPSPANGKKTIKTDVEDKHETTVHTTPGSCRPKRACTGKIDYAQLFNSPEKSSPEKTSNTAKTKREKNDDVIYVDENSPVKKKQNVKLAPLFVKKVPKPAIDPAVLEARRNFLLSELPANLRVPIEKQRQYEDDILSNEMVAFPNVSHITQLAYEDKSYSHEDIFHNSKIRVIQNENDDMNMGSMTLKYGMLTDCMKSDDINAVMRNDGLKEASLQPLSDIKEAVRGVKESCENFPVNRCFKQILSKLKCAKDEATENGISHLNSTFVEIFKPAGFEEFLIGLEPVKQLQEFLNTWNDRSGRCDNYESDDSSSRQSMRGMNNCVVLSGLNGSGKTSSVYALANDLNYEVIEINAGSKRNGKKILQDLLEATQSHRVEKNLMDDESSVDNFQNDGADKKTIILIEDAELSFENDDGFVSSIQQLINISKRPVILTTNDSSCQHLQKFIQHNEIVYDVPKKYLAKYLSLICVATANYQIDEKDIENLYSFNRRDLRKTINEIEFFIRSESASVNNGSLMGLFCGSKNKNKLKKSSQMAFHSQRGLSALHSRSSIISDFSIVFSCLEQKLRGDEISYHEQDLMNEVANFLDESNLLKTKYQNDSTQKDQQQIISSSISHEICSSSTSKRAKSVDYSPLLRHICRSEKSREISRRTNRSHYLRHHLPTAPNINEYFNTQCSVFQENEDANV